MNEYADLAELKEFLTIKVGDGTRDALLQRSLTAASRQIDEWCGRRFYLDDTATARIYDPRRRTVSDPDGDRLLIDDVGSATGLVVETGSGGSYVVASGIENYPENAIAQGRPITSLLSASGFPGGYGRVRVTARWGWPEVPTQIVEATLIRASSLYKRKDSPEGVIGSSDWGTIRVSRMDPDVSSLIAPFVLAGFG